MGLGSITTQHFKSVFDIDKSSDVFGFINAFIFPFTFSSWTKDNLVVNYNGRIKAYYSSASQIAPFLLVSKLVNSIKDQLDKNTTLTQETSKETEVQL